MRFVTREVGTEVALTHGINKTSLSMIPSGIYLSGIALVRVIGRRGSTILATTPSHLSVYGKNGEVVWNQPLSDLTFEIHGLDLIRLSVANEILEVGTGLSQRKELIAHLDEAVKNSENAATILEDLRRIEAQIASVPVEEVKKPASDTKLIREQQKAERHRLKRELDEKNQDNFGKLVIEGVCAGKTVRIYSNGYVRVSGFFGGSTPYEKLLGISASADVSKKTAIGRGVVAAATLGANLLYTSNKRGDMYLAISTDRNTHMLHMSPPTERDMKAMHKLATAGQAILDSVGSLHVTTDKSPQASRKNDGSISIADEIAKLVVLRDSGALTAEEFQAAKKKLL